MYEPSDIPACKMLVGDDHGLFAEGFKELLLKLTPKNCSVDVYTSIARVAASLEIQTYQFLFIDLLVPGENAITFITSFRERYPSLIIIVVSSVIEISTVETCLASGANGYISKAAGHEEIKKALEHTYRGERFISSDLGAITRNRLSAENTLLSPTEQEVLQLIAAGLSTRNIADRLDISPVKIMTHKRSLMRKLNLDSAAALISYASGRQPD